MRRGRDGEWSRNLSEVLEFGGYFVDELLEGYRTIFLESRQVFTDSLIKTARCVQTNCQLEAETIYARRIAVKLRRANGEFDEVLILAIGSAQVEVHPA